MAQICFLSGIAIPNGKYSKEHVAPRSRVPQGIAQQPYNIRPAIKIFNFIKGNRFLCEWEEQKYDLIRHAYFNWNIKQQDKKLLRQALNGMPKINPCEHCICAKHVQYCINRKLLERSL